MTNTVGSIWLGGTARQGKSMGGAIEVSKARTVAAVLVRQLLTSVLWAIVCPAVSLSQVSARRKNGNVAVRFWRTRYVEGPIQVKERGELHTLPAQTTLKVRIEKEKVVFPWKKKEAFSIPSDTITGIYYRHDVYSRSRQVFAPDGVSAAIGRCADSPGYGPALCVMVALPVYAASAPFHYREHFIHITWRVNPSDEDEVEQEMELRVGKGEYRSLTASLERASGKKCERIEPRDPGQTN